MLDESSLQRAICGPMDRADSELFRLDLCPYAAVGLTHLYYSYNRPLWGWLFPECARYEVLGDSGRWLLLDRPLSLDEVCRWELAGGDAETRGRIQVEWYRHKHGADAAPAWYEVRKHGWVGIVFTPSLRRDNGAWQSTFFDARGPISHQYRDNLYTFVMEYARNRDWRMMSPERVRQVWQSEAFLAGIDGIIEEHGVN